MDAARLTASRIMRTDFVSLRERDRLDLAEHVMKLGGVRHLPVLDDHRRLVGIVSQRDLLRASLTSVLDFAPEHRRTFLSSVDVAEVMTREVQSVSPDTPLGVAASRMVRHRIGCLPVVGEDGVAVGLLTETDLLVAAYLAPGNGGGSASPPTPSSPK
jgi:CBS-domain-containing membrane protein